MLQPSPAAARPVGRVSPGSLGCLPVQVNRPNVPPPAATALLSATPACSSTATTTTTTTSAAHPCGPPLLLQEAATTSAARTPSCSRPPLLSATHGRAGCEGSGAQSPQLPRYLPFQAQKQCAAAQAAPQSDAAPDRPAQGGDATGSQQPGAAVLSPPRGRHHEAQEAGAVSGVQAPPEGTSAAASSAAASVERRRWTSCEDKMRKKGRVGEAVPAPATDDELSRACKRL